MGAFSTAPLTAASVSVTQLNQNTSAVLALARRGEHLAITERGKVIAVLAPTHPHPLAHLVAEGKLHPPTELTIFRQASALR